ncbi:MAG: ankyrin repeat domain-containing protein [Parasphingorhabdus sp.]|uniref:ankyrin repeat domain-containing protein n=1 Tax=Parasphingorhabdus sp. TaxID=2709688 RepID=UPI0032992A82
MIWGNKNIVTKSANGTVSRLLWTICLIFSLALPGAVHAQFSASYNFLQAVKDRDGTEATKFLNQPGTVIVNTRDVTSGETALHIVVARRDATWTTFLLQKGANPNLRDKSGTAPLMLATRLRFVEGARILLAKKADVNLANNRGETALIRAVQLRDSEMVRLLLKNGADADLTDTLAGLSARDYATRDRRAASILAEIEKNDGEEKTKSTGRFFGPQG